MSATNSKPHGFRTLQRDVIRCCSHPLRLLISWRLGGMRSLRACLEWGSLGLRLLGGRVKAGLSGMRYKLWGLRAPVQEVGIPARRAALLGQRPQQNARRAFGVYNRLCRKVAVSAQRAPRAIRFLLHFILNFRRNQILGENPLLSDSDRREFLLMFEIACRNTNLHMFRRISCSLQCVFVVRIACQALSKR